MKIGLIDADLMDNGTRHPNLALMKIAGYHNSLGDNVKLIWNSYLEVYNFDKIYIAKVFTFTDVPGWVLELPNVVYGGTGFFEEKAENLPPEIEHHMPYYHLYDEYVDVQLKLGKKRSSLADYMDYSIGFTTRGCFRKCSFCVNRKYDHAFKHSPVEEFYDNTRPYIYLWDDNFFAYKDWETILDTLESTGRPFQFRQGLDLRLMTDRRAYRFNNTHYHGDFIFAFDHLHDKDIIIKNVQIWKRYSSKVCKMYVLSGFDSQDEKDIETVFERIAILMKYGSLPYIMRYIEYKNSPLRGMYVELARWCNQPQFFKKKSFREFCEANQFYKKNKETNCAAYQTMLDFQEKFPELANKYFDLKFEEENIYNVQYGYGRKYANKPLCSLCKKNNVCWNDILNSEKNVEKHFIELYLTKEIDLQCMSYKNSECLDKEIIVKRLVDILLKYSIEECIEIIKQSDKREYITKENIPQFSDLDDATINLNKILVESGDSSNYKEIGYYLRRDEEDYAENVIALKKYGENHSKLSTLIDLSVINNNIHTTSVTLSLMGEYFYCLSELEKQRLLKRLYLRIPIIQNILIDGDFNNINKFLSVLAESTVKRRRSNVEKVVRSILEDGEELSKKFDLEGM